MHLVGESHFALFYYNNWSVLLILHTLIPSLAVTIEVARR